MSYELEKLSKTYEKHGKIIVGLDFDDTVFPLVKDEYIEKRCLRVRKAIYVSREMITLCLYTSSSNKEMKYKEWILAGMGIVPDFINESPVKFDTNKPYFNLLLDDKAGLNEALEILEQFTNKHKSK